MAEGPLDVVVRTEPDRVILAVSGDVDLASAGTLRTCIDEVDAACLVLDMGSVTFLDSSGIAVLVRANSALKSEGRQLQLRNLSQPSRRVLEIAGILDLLMVIPAEPPAPVIGQPSTSDR